MTRFAYVHGRVSTKSSDRSLLYSSTAQGHHPGDKGLGFGLYTILFYFKALLWESIIPSPPPPPAKPTLLHYYCTTSAQYTPPPTPPVYAMHHTILVMAISCKGQVRVNPRTRIVIISVIVYATCAVRRCSSTTQCRTAVYQHIIVIIKGAL